ncbi:MAG: type VI secretion system protein TssA [Candidatus Accumulibacter sp.]|jgi:type VI secretion system protein VasJ|nr:type VI secretion system protein TssA [Accumulibacter sp.]
MSSSGIDPRQYAAGRVPLPENLSAGQNARDDARFSEMRQEIDKLTSIQPDAAGPDWGKVADLGAELLTNLGKDISVASWLGAALLHLKGEEGIAAGAVILADLCSLYWETLAPPAARLRARVGAVDWWQSQVENWLDTAKPEFLSAGVKTAADDALRLLDDTFNNAGPNSSLRLHALRARLGRLPAPPEAVSETAKSAATAKPAPDAAQASVSESAARAENTAALPGAPAIAGDASSGAFLSGCSRFCLDVAEALLSRDLSLPASYILRRTALWGGLTKLPPVEGGRTSLPAPEDHLLPGLSALFHAGEHEKVVRNAESYANAHLYWLDLCRVSAQALAALGAPYAAARLALEGQVAGLLLRFPELSALSFADGTPFADGATRQWLSGLSGAGAPADPFDAELAAAAAHPPAAALDALGRLLLRHVGDKYTLTLYRSAFAACLKGELWPPLPFLSARLLDLVAAHGLAAYDPVAAAEALSAAIEALTAALAADADNTRLREQYARVGVILAGLQPHRLLPSSG